MCVLVWMGGGWKLPCLGCDLPFERGGDLVQLTRQLGPFDLGQSIDGLLLQEATIGLVGERMEGRDEAEVSHSRFHGEAQFKGKTDQDPVIDSTMKVERVREAEKDAFVVSHLEKREHLERWRNAGRDVGMLLMCRDETEERTM